MFAGTGGDVSTEGKKGFFKGPKLLENQLKIRPWFGRYERSQNTLGLEDRAKSENEIVVADRGEKSEVRLQKALEKRESEKERTDPDTEMLLHAHEVK